MLDSRAAVPACLHCGTETQPGVSFCCSGCESVYTLLSSKGLAHFYNLRDRSFVRPAPPVLQVVSGGGEEIPASLDTQKFYLEGIHCLGCLWLLERIPEIEPRIRESSLDFAHSILQIKKTESISWPDTCALIRQLGYVPRPLRAEEKENARSADFRRQLMRLGIAGFCGGNIMLLTIALYGGAEGILARSFQLLSFALSLPALTYSAWPIYRSAIAPLRHGRISVDLAVSLALWIGFGWSLYNLVAGERAETYFDSLTMLVFLLLASRFLLNSFRESLAKESACLSFLSQIRYERLSPSASLRVIAEELMPGDRILLRSGQPLPTDSVLRSEGAHFDLSLLTGESEPVKSLYGDAVEAGARLLSTEAELVVKNPAQESRLAQILEQVRSYQHTRSPSLDFADRIGQRFVLVVLALAVLTAVILPFPEGLQRALVLVIVTCPCVLAFAVPLAFTRAIQQSAKAGILFRSAQKIEDLASAETVFLDKTGTLTEGKFKILRWQQLAGDLDECQRAVYALEIQSSHPVAKTLIRSLHYPSRIASVVKDFREIAGRGVQGDVDGVFWEVKRLENSHAPQNLVSVVRQGTPVATIMLGDDTRADASIFIDKLRALNLRPVILSGDNNQRVAAVASSLGIEDWHGRLDPQGKAAIVKRTDKSVMIGDGANDAVAFQAARVAIAVRGAVDLSVKNADVVLTDPSLESAVRAIEVARSTMALVRANFGISLAYNLLAGALAVSGRMSPLLAASLMPVSALSVFAFTQWRTRRLA